jgi:hypothetical protein
MTNTAVTSKYSTLVNRHVSLSLKLGYNSVLYSKPIHTLPLGVGLQCYTSIYEVCSKLYRNEFIETKQRAEAMLEAMRAQVSGPYILRRFIFDIKCAAYIGIGGMRIENEPRH